ncbi:hypothetical protein [Algoriphagus namhaensis]
MKVRIIILLLFTCLFGGSVKAQQETSLGAILLYEDPEELDATFRAGIVFNHKFTKRSGIETSLITRTDRVFGVVETGFTDGTIIRDSFTLKEVYLEFPVLYKFHSRIVNVAVGPSFDIFVGWSQISGQPEAEVISHSPSSRVIFGLMGKVSKSFNLFENFILEPEIRISELNNTRSFIGAGFSLRYRFKKPITLTNPQ